MVTYTTSLTGLSPDQLHGFFVGWPNPPSPETHLRILQGSAHVVLAVDEATVHVVGFINAISDGVLMAYIPLLEVLPDYQGRGIGMELTRRMLNDLKHLYSVDLLCDQDVEAFYAKAGMVRAMGMALRNYARQNGAPQ
jgi:ribosomal protein S18 acetylase RimI-like enzyme